MDFATIQSRLYSRLNFKTGVGDPVVRLAGYINQAHREVLRKKQCARFRRAMGIPITTIANSPYVTLPQAAVRVFKIQDRTNQRDLEEKSVGYFKEFDPGLLRGSSFPDYYAIVNYSSNVARQPSDASELFFKSTAGGDDNSKTIYVEGMTAGGYYRTRQTAMNGLTAVSLGNGSPTDWIEIQKFYLALSAVGGGATTAIGVITLLEDSGVGTELARIPIGRSYPRYTTIQLYPFPTSAITLYVDAEMHIEEMVMGGDEPLIPEDFHEVLIERALMLEYERRESPVPYSQCKARVKEIMSDLYMYVARQTTRDTNRPMRWSQLGPYFPAGS